jgi:hypothetical protein
MAKKRRHPCLVGLLREVSSVTQNSSSSFGSDTYPEGDTNGCDDEDTTTTIGSNPLIAINMSTTSQERYANSNITTSNVHFNHPHHPTNLQDIGSQLRHQLPPLEVGGLASIDSETLRTFVSPIYDALTSIDAEELLDLERINEGGARLGNGYVCI